MNPSSERQRRAAGVVLLLACASLAVALATGAHGYRADAAVRPPMLDLNTASADDLQLLPGIGPALAARIVADRETRGPFERVDDLERVQGMGERLVRRAKEHATAGE